MSLGDNLRPCVRCLSRRHFRQRAGHLKLHAIIQCPDCSFNVTAVDFVEAEKVWNGFEIWKLFDKVEALLGTEVARSVLSSVVVDHIDLYGFSTGFSARPSTTFGPTCVRAFRSALIQLTAAVR